MANNGHFFGPDAFENLLLDTIIEDYNDNTEIQKSIDMTADFIQSNSVSIAISTKLENAFLQSAKSSKFLGLISGKLFMLFMSVILVTAISITSFNYFKNTDYNLIAVVNDGDSLMYKRKTHKYLHDAEIVQAALNIDSVGDSVLLPKNSSLLLDISSFYRSRNTHHSRALSSFSVPKSKSTINWYSNNEFDYDIAKSIIIEDDFNKKIHTAKYNLVAYRLALISNIFLYQHYSFSPFYEGKPFNKGFDNMEFVNIIKNSAIIKNNYSKYSKLKWADYSLMLPNGLNYYYNYNDSNESPSKFFQKKENAKYFRPFYISKTEVNNTDYKEFMKWVVKYNGYERINLENHDSIYAEPQAFVYTFHLSNNEVIKHFGTNSVNILPNSNVWKSDFPKGYMDAFIKHYLTHPAYDYYPVVGVSYWQALAYTDWMTYIWQNRLDKQNIPYEIEIDLPYDYEVELALRKNLKNENLLKQWGSRNLQSSICDLAVKSINDREYRNVLGLRQAKTTKKADYYYSRLVSSPAYNYEKTPSVIGLGGNVSEWTKENYNSEWENYIKKYHQILNEENNYSRSGILPIVKKKATAERIAVNKAQRNMILNMEKYFDESCNSKNGKLVRGANWYDKRINYRKAALAKAFVNPDEQHSTIGFRYVMRVKLKDESKALDKINILGRNLPEMDFSMEKNNLSQKEDWYQVDPNGFAFVPMGSFNFHEKTTSVQAFYAQKAEVTNLQWMIFLNYLIDNDKKEDLQECIPKDKFWAVKMTYENDSLFATHDNKTTAIESLPFSKKFVRVNNVKKLKLNSFAAKPIVGISHKAAVVYAKWVSEIYGLNIDFRLPTEIEWEYMAHGGLKEGKYPWGGPYTRNSDGVYNANFKWKEVEMRYNRAVKIDFFTPNNYGIYNLSGNVAEMIRNANFTKGGSYESSENDITIEARKKWDAKATNTVGFRLVQTYIGKIQKPQTPPGTVLLDRSQGGAFCNGLHIIEREGLYGLMDSQGKEVVSPKYNRIFPCGNMKIGWAKVEFEGLSGFIDSQGKEVVPPKYERIYPFGNMKEGWAMVKRDGLSGFIDSEGNEVVELKYHKIFPFGNLKNGWAMVKHDGLSGFIDSEGKEVVSTKYDRIYPFGNIKDGWAMVQHEGLSGFIDSEGKEVVPPKYDRIYPFGNIKDGWAKVELDGLFGFIDYQGKEVVKPKYDNIEINKM